MKKSVFVTGAHDGTGFAIAERFAKEGYDVFIGSREIEKAEAAANKITEKYGVFSKGYCYQTVTLCDDEVKAIFDDIRSRGYLLDTLVLNAANLGIGQVSLDVDINEFMGVFTTNIGWNFLMAREAAKQMREKGKGAIVFIGSNSSQRVTENRCAYCSSKSAINAMSKSFAVDWGKYGIRSNCVLPGMIKTIRWENNVNNCKYCLPNYTPIEDIASFEDVANAAWYFGSDQSRNTTGAEIVVDGGMLAQLTPNIERELWK
jgi:NAD(P)-dependent dehydrogenase (short-subunit alcohol dehydrogenase family)